MNAQLKVSTKDRRSCGAGAAAHPASPADIAALEARAERVRAGGGAAIAAVEADEPAREETLARRFMDSGGMLEDYPAAAANVPSCCARWGGAQGPPAAASANTAAEGAGVVSGVDDGGEGEASGRGAVGCPAAAPTEVHPACGGDCAVRTGAGCGLAAGRGWWSSGGSMPSAESRRDAKGGGLAPPAAKDGGHDRGGGGGGNGAGASSDQGRGPASSPGGGGGWDAGRAAAAQTLVCCDAEALECQEDGIHVWDENSWAGSKGGTGPGLLDRAGTAGLELSEYEHLDDHHIKQVKERKRKAKPDEAPRVAARSSASSTATLGSGRSTATPKSFGLSVPVSPIFAEEGGQYSETRDAISCPAKCEKSRYCICNHTPNDKTLRLRPFRFGWTIIWNCCCQTELSYQSASVRLRLYGLCICPKCKNKKTRRKNGRQTLQSKDGEILGIITPDPPKPNTQDKHYDYLKSEELCIAIPFADIIQGLFFMASFMANPMSDESQFPEDAKAYFQNAVKNTRQDIKEPAKYMKIAIDVCAEIKCGLELLLKHTKVAASGEGIEPEIFKCQSMCNLMVASIDESEKTKDLFCSLAGGLKRICDLLLLGSSLKAPTASVAWGVAEAGNQINISFKDCASTKMCSSEAPQSPSSTQPICWNQDATTPATQIQARTARPVAVPSSLEGWASFNTKARLLFGSKTNTVTLENSRIDVDCTDARLSPGGPVSP